MNDIQKSYEEGVLLFIKKSVRKLFNIFSFTPKKISPHLIPFLLVLYKKKIIRWYDFKDDSKFTFQELLSHYTGPDSDVINKVYSILHSEIKDIPLSNFNQVVEILDSFDERIFEDNFEIIFNDYLEFFQRNLKGTSDFPLLPPEIVEVFGRLGKVEMGGSVFNPFAGDYSLTFSLAGFVKVFSQEPNQMNWAYGIIRALAYNFDNFEDFELSGPFINSESKSRKYDLIYSAPPFRCNFVDSNFNVISIGEMIIRESINLLKESGKLIVWVPQSFMASDSMADSSLRKHLVVNNYLEKVISFPGGLLSQTTIPFSILIISNKKERNEEILFVDAAGFVNTISKREKQLDVKGLIKLLNSSEEQKCIRYINNSEISVNNYKLNANRYLLGEEDLSNDRYEIIKLGDLASPALINSKLREGQLGKFIRIRDLKGDIEDFQINLNDFEYSEIPKQAYKVDSCNLLMALRFSKLKPTILKNGFESFFVSKDIAAFKVDTTKVDIRYLISELNSSYVESQISRFRTGTTIPSISKSDLLELKIRLLNLEEQKLRVEAEYDILERNRLTTYKTDQIGDSEAVHDQNVFLRHKLAGPAQTLEGTVLNIISLFQSQVFPDYPHLRNLKLSDKHLYTLDDYLSMMVNQSNSIINVVRSQLRIEQEILSKKLSPINLNYFFNSYVHEVEIRQGKSFDIKYDFTLDDELKELNEDNLFILANEDLLRDMMNNFVENAVVHAFENGQNNRIEISLFPNSVSEGEVVVNLLVSNTGKPLSDNFKLQDYIRKGFSIGNSGGEGFGGWYINQIVKRFNGQLDYIDETGPEGLPDTDLATTFVMSFPIYLNA